MDTEPIRQQARAANERRRERAPGAARRGRVAAEAAQLANVAGLDGLTIGELAKRLDMPKSSLYVLFGAKEALQLATVESARLTFIEDVVVPALDEGADGRERLLRLADGYLDHVRRRVFPSGCFFAQAAAEMSGRTGELRDRVAEVQDEWRELLVAQTRAAADLGELGGEPDQTAFEIGAILTGAAILAALHGDDAFCDRAALAVRRFVDA